MAQALRPIGWLALGAGAVMALVLWWLRRPRMPVIRTAAGLQPSAREPRSAAPVAEPAPRGPAFDEFVRFAPPARAVPPTQRAGPPLARPASWGPEVFDQIEWRRFEAVVETLFQQAGFETRSQTHGADGGVDIWLHSKSVPDRPVSIVQCKHWQGKKVGVDKVRELRGVMAAQGVKRGQFATTSTFTPDAMDFARENSIHLLDVNALLALIAQRSPEQQQALLTVALEGDYWRPTCVNCGTKLVERVPKNGGTTFWGCPTFPKCRTTMPMRAG
jgi:restriction system protein